MTSAAVQERELPWWLVLIEGIALVILSLFLLAKPGMTTVIVIQFLGIYWFIAGIFKIIGIFIDSEMWGWKLFAGIVGIIAGIVVIQHPLWSTAVVGNTVIILLGIAGIIMGGVSVYQGYKGSSVMTGILGVVSLILGIVLLMHVWFFAVSLPWVLGIFALVGGVATIVAAFRLK